MAFDFNEARAMIEDAKKRGLIRTSDSPDTGFSESSSKTKSTKEVSKTILPDWLQKEIR